MCVFYTIGGGWGGGGGLGRRRGVDFQERVWSLISPLVEKKVHFLTQKESACQILADSKQLEKLQWNRYIRPPSMEPFNYYSLKLLLSIYPGYLSFQKLHQFMQLQHRQTGLKLLRVENFPKWNNCYQHISALILLYTCGMLFQVFLAMFTHTPELANSEGHLTTGLF